jgi:hypothetical protein
MGACARTLLLALLVASTATASGVAQRAAPAQDRERLELSRDARDLFHSVFGPMPPRARPKPATTVPLPRPAPVDIRLPSEQNLLPRDAMVIMPEAAPPPTGEIIEPKTDALEQFVELHASHTSTMQALAALAGSVKLSYAVPPTVNRDLNGRYSGSLRRVLARILDGADYFVKKTDDRIEVIVLDPLGTSAASFRAGSEKAIPSKLTVSSAPPLASFLTDK